MNKYTDFPEKPRVMSDAEGEWYFESMLKQIAMFEPDEIIAVNRSGFSYAQWAAQLLKLPMGAYWPSAKKLVVTDDSHRKLVFVDDNVLKGDTYLDTKKFMQDKPHEWKWAVLFSDWGTPEQIRSEIIQGIRLPYFAEEPVWGSKKISKAYGVRHRDE